MNWWGRGRERKSVAAGEFSQIDGQPPVMGEVEKFNFAKERDLDGLRSESPRIWIAAEFEAGQKQANTRSGARTGDQWELLEDIRGTCSRDCDPDEAILGPCRFDLASHAGDWDFRGSRFPLALGAEPCDGLFVRLDPGSRGSDTARVDDLFEFRAGREVEDVFGRIGTGGWLVGRWDGNEMDVDFHRGPERGAGFAVLQKNAGPKP